ncbi:MAG: hypothetical protein M1821_005961 [Bathelium mastoideum]|nr:MAG: hypothetical protein M1821_005961 [Bathelium mastoideum]KAI9688501.1 MAG: hypothetical protein M1822_001450 [Bathelium mastoideum]
MIVSCISRWLHLLLALPSSLTLAALYHPTPQISQLEHLLVDTDGAYRSGFKDAITPCTNYLQGPQTLGRETAAQWLRVAFHDFVTARVSEGIGGIDASIGFETTRAENSGTAFNDSFSFWAKYVNAQVSMADVLALATVTSVGNCHGPKIPYRGGRVDATGPGPSGVPAPDTDLDTTLAYFANAGFNQVDSIKLTACGHTLGSVHHGGFPTVMDNSTVSPDNTQGAGHLDTTNAGYDSGVVNEYLQGTGQRGGPLVTSFNESSRSDLRLYTSDGNATMKGLAAGGTEGFFDTCVDLLARMLNTVPSSVRLTDVVQPMQIKPVNVTFDLDQSGTLILRGALRYLASGSDSAPSSITLAAVSTSQTSTALASHGSSIYGTTSFYPFTLTFTSSSASPLSLTVTTSNSPSTKQRFPLQPSLFLVPSLSSIAANSSTANSSVLTITAAHTLSVHSLTAIVAYPVSQQGTLAPRMVTQNVTLPSTGRTKEGTYELAAGTATVPAEVRGQVSVDVVGLGNGGEVVIDAFNFLSDE